jgi:hypothetical protein
MNISYTSKQLTDELVFIQTYGTRQDLNEILNDFFVESKYKYVWALESTLDYHTKQPIERAILARQEKKKIKGD